jgi:hypothetical protein
MLRLHWACCSGILTDIQIALPLGDWVGQSHPILTRLEYESLEF